jgi:hypothetical protein
LDCHIHAPIEGRNIKPERWIEAVRLHDHAVPRYTASLDAAVTLVPEGCDWHCQSNPSVSACWASVSPMKVDSKLQEWGSGMRRASTAALALCAAALRARAAAHD